MQVTVLDDEVWLRNSTSRTPRRIAVPSRKNMGGQWHEVRQSKRAAAKPNNHIDTRLNAFLFATELHRGL
jgi:hypothetical protein